MYKISLTDENRFVEMARLQMDAYPGYNQNAVPEQYAERLEAYSKREDINSYSVCKDNKLVGGFCIWDFDLNMRQTMIKASGIGSVAVDIGHKKEKVALELMRFYINDLRDRGITMAMLYPFNSAFYKKMGFGFGTTLNQFRIKPDDLPGGNSKAYIVRLSEADANKMADFYNSQAKRTHGLTLKPNHAFATTLKTLKNKVFAYVDNGKICGYIAFQFQEGSKENGLINDMVVNELLFESPAVFAELMTFVKSQSDQIRYVIFNTQDEGFGGTVPDPRNHTDRMLAPIFQEVCRTGYGLMYRICDVPAFFEEIGDCNFGDLNLNLRINVSDSFVLENNSPILLEFVDGHCSIAKKASANVVLDIDIAELSSLMMGNVNLTTLVKYGLATVSDSRYLGMLSSAFAVNERPICLTYF